jgi:hypothetical protein
MKSLKLAIALLIGLALAITVGVNHTLSSSQNNHQVYQPPIGRTRRQIRQAGGSRGCPKKLANSIILLVPPSHIPLTEKEHPTFMWYVATNRDRPYKVHFTLLKPGFEPIFFTQLTFNQEEIVALKLPENSPPLEINQPYRWTVSIICNPQQPSANIYTQAWIERIPQSNKVSQLINPKNQTRCTINYA